MVKKAILIATFLAFLAFPGSVRATEPVAGSSAAINKADTNTQKEQEADSLFLKRKAIKAVLESYDSNLVSSVDAFLTSCTKYDIDCYLLPSITGVESYFGKYLVQGSYNPFGWGGGYIYFKDYADAINTVASGLKNDYINKGADNVDKIGPIYAQSSTWAPKVKYFMEKFAQEEQNAACYLKIIK